MADNEGGMRVGNRVKVELELECIFFPHDSGGSMTFRYEDCIARVSDEEREIGFIGGGIGGQLVLTIEGQEGFLILQTNARQQWEAIMSALTDQYGIKPGRAF